MAIRNHCCAPLRSAGGLLEPAHGRLTFRYNWSEDTLSFLRSLRLPLAVSAGARTWTTGGLWAVGGACEWTYGRAQCRWEPPGWVSPTWTHVICHIQRESVRGLHRNLLLWVSTSSLCLLLMMQFHICLNCFFFHSLKTYVFNHSIYLKTLWIYRSGVCQVLNSTNIPHLMDDDTNLK